MSSKLLKQLKREASRSPKKAAILGLLILVACYAWAPLALKWLKTDKAQIPAVMEVAAISPPPPEAPSTGDQQRWQDVADLLDTDARMRPARLAADRNPFVPLAILNTQPELDRPPAPLVEATPAELGMVLVSTVVGQKRRTAMINGRAYSEGREVTAEDGTVFVLSEIGPRRIVLRRGDRDFELAIVRASTDDGPTIRPTNDR